MVKEARFSLPPDESGLAYREFPVGAYDDLDDLVGDDHLPPAPRGRGRKQRRKGPIDRRADRRHLAGADWLTDADFVEDEAAGNG